MRNDTQWRSSGEKYSRPCSHGARRKLYHTSLRSQRGCSFMGYIVRFYICISRRATRYMYCVHESRGEVIELAQIADEKRPQRICIIIEFAILQTSPLITLSSLSPLCLIYRKTKESIKLWICARTKLIRYGKLLFARRCWIFRGKNKRFFQLLALHFAQITHRRDGDYFLFFRVTVICHRSVSGSTLKARWSSARVSQFELNRDVFIYTNGELVNWKARVRLDSSNCLSQSCNA